MIIGIGNGAGFVLRYDSMETNKKLGLSVCHGDGWVPFVRDRSVNICSMYVYTVSTWIDLA